MMLNTSSSEDDDYDLPAVSARGTNQEPAGWRSYDYRSLRYLDLRSKPSDGPSSRKSSGAGDTASMYARFPIGSRGRTTPSPVAGGWQPLHVDSSSKPDSPQNMEPQRAPRLSALSQQTTYVHGQRDPSAGQIGTDTRVGSGATGTGGQFSVSFEGISESGPMGTRLSPVGSSCWSSEQHISPDLTSLMSSSTNSVSAGLSLSSGRHAIGHGIYPNQTHPNAHTAHHQQLLQRQPSAGTGCSGGAYSIETGHHLKSTTHSVRSAPLCLGSPIEARCFRQLTLDVQPGSKGSGPTPPSLIVSDPEEELHQKRLQIYVFASRCVACPVLCPISQGPTRRYLKVTKDYLMTLKERFQMFLKGELAITCDEAFRNAISDFFEVVLESDRIASMVKSGACSMYDIREVFITNIEKRFQTHQLVEGLSKESVVSAWKIKFDQICRGGERPCPVAMTLAVPQAEVTNPSKDQLYDLLMRTLMVQKYEHQVLYNACQLDNADEQAAQIRRELAERLATIERMAKERSLPKLVHKEMETQYIEEEKLRANELIRRLDSIPVLKSLTATAGPVQRRFRKHPIRLTRSQRTEETKTARADPESELWSKQYGLDSTGSVPLLPGSYGSLSPGQQSISRADAYSLTDSVVTAAYHGHGVSRDAVRLDFTLEILVCQLRNLRHLSPSKKLYCTIELEGNVDRKRTEPVTASKPVWDTTAEFHTTQPLPALKLKVFKESSGPLAIDDKELGKITLYPTWSSARVPQWLRLQVTKHCQDAIELQASVSMQRPTNLKFANHCWIQGRTTFKKWKRRYICLTQVSQYTFVLAAYGEQKAQPSEFMALDGFTVDYCESRPDLIRSASSTRNVKPDHHLSSSSLSSLSRLRFGSLNRTSSIHPRSGSTMNVASATGEPEPTAAFFFKLVREGDSVIVATATESDRQNWVQAIYRATGQTHKPSLPSQANLVSSVGSIPGGASAGSTSGGKQSRETESNRPGGLEELALNPPHTFDQLELFIELQSRSLDQRLQDSFVSLGWPSPSQKIILEEYCTRYGIRECQRHLAFLDNLLDKAEHGLRIDPDLIHLSYSLCANHVTGKTNHDQAVHTVLAAEREHFQAVKQRLTTLLERQITEFRYCFPFGRPEGALEKTIGLLERVLTKENGEPASADIVRNVIRICLRNAAVLNYERISEYATIEAVSGIRIQGMDATNERMQQMIHLAELCIEVLKQNEEHHAESFAWFSDLFVAHAENFWSLFQMDLFDLMDHLPDCRWEVFDLFQLLNDYLCNDANLCNGHFHQNLANRFAPLVDRYVELMAESIEQALVTGCENERWVPAATVVGPGAGTNTSNNENLMLNGSSQNAQRPSLISPPTTYPGHSPSLSARSSIGVIGKSSIVSSPRSIRDLGAGMVMGSTSGLPFTSEPFACPQSSSSMTGSLACQTVVELLWRLHKLKHFIQELAWPQSNKAKLLDEQIRVLCAQMLREAVKRTLIELESWVRKCVKTPDLVLPLECCTMLNTVTELRAHLFSLCHATDLSTNPGSPRYTTTTTTIAGPGTGTTTTNSTQTANQLHIETEEFFESVQRNMMVIVVDHFLAVLTGVLNKLTRFDENRLISSILTLTKPVDEEGRSYTNFLNVNLQRLSQNLVDEVSMISLCESWYSRQMRMIYEWLVHRKSMLLHPYQIKCLSNIVKKIFAYFELQGLSKSVLDTIAYQTVSQRLQVEETAHSVKQETGSSSSGSAGKRKILSAFTGSTVFNRN